MEGDQSNRWYSCELNIQKLQISDLEKFCSIFCLFSSLLRPISLWKELKDTRRRRQPVKEETREHNEKHLTVCISCNKEHTQRIMWSLFLLYTLSFYLPCKVHILPSFFRPLYTPPIPSVTLWIQLKFQLILFYHQESHRKASWSQLLSDGFCRCPSF